MVKDWNRIKEWVISHWFVFAIGAVTFGVIVAQRSLLEPGLPITHDSQNHLARFANYYLETKQGQIPPRWASNLNLQFGYPVFNFNYPLANILAIPFIVLNFSVQQTMKIQLWLCIFLSSVGMYLWLKRYFSVLGSLLAAFYYSLSPYVLSLIQIRGVVGELWAYALLPWLLYLIDRLFDNPKKMVFQMQLLFVASLFLLSHNIMVLASLPLLAGYTLYKSRHDWHKLSYAAIIALLSVCVVSFFWLPALAEKHFTSIDSSDLQAEYSHHLLWLDQALWGKTQSGFSLPGPVDGMNFGMGIFGISIIFLSLILFFKKSNRPVYILMVFGTLLGLLFFMSVYSASLWPHIPLASYIQFPWRLGLFIPLLLSILLGFILQNLKHEWMFFFIGIVIILCAYTPVANETRFDYPDEHWFSFPETSSTKNENMPVWVVENPTILRDLYFKNQPIFAPTGSPLFSDISWLGHTKSYTIEADQDIELVHALIYFPGWKAWIDNREVPIEYLQPPYQGLITIHTSAGKHHVQLMFTQLTWPRIIGNTISAITITLIFMYCIWHFVARKMHASNS